MAAAILSCDSSEQAAAADVVAKSSDFSADHCENFDLEEGELVPEEEEKVEPDAVPHLSELAQRRALQRLVSSMKSLMGNSICEAMETVDEPADHTVPIVDGTHIEDERSYVDDVHVIQDEDSEPPQVVHALEDDSERKRSCLDGVPIRRFHER